MKVKYINLLIILSLLISSSLQAQYKTISIRGLKTKTIHSSFESERLITRIPGLGHLKLILKRNDLKINNTKTTSNILFQGKVYANNFESLVTGILFKRLNQEYLEINFPALVKNSFKDIRLIFKVNNLNHGRIIKKRNITSETCGTKDLNLKASLPTTAEAAKSNKRKKIRIVIDADKYIYQVLKEQTFDYLSNFINQVDLIYKNELNLSLEIKAINIHKERSFGSESIHTIYAYRSHSLKQRYKDADVHHLFTANTIGNGVSGIAFVGSICNDMTKTFGVSKLSSISGTAITFAHELAHNLGATHDLDLPVSIMYPAISIYPPQNFSIKSKKEISPASDSLNCLKIDRKLKLERKKVKQGLKFKLNLEDFLECENQILIGKTKKKFKIINLNNKNINFNINKSLYNNQNIFIKAKSICEDAEYLTDLKRVDLTNFETKTNFTRLFKSLKKKLIKN